MLVPKQEGVHILLSKQSPTLHALEQIAVVGEQLHVVSTIYDQFGKSRPGAGCEYMMQYIVEFRILTGRFILQSECSKVFCGLEQLGPV